MKHFRARLSQNGQKRFEVLEHCHHDTIMETENLALLIPIIAIVFGCSIPIVWVFMDYLKKRHLYDVIHQERMAAVDKGLDLPPWPEDLLSPKINTAHPRRYLRRGLFWIFLGVSVASAIYFSGDGRRARVYFCLIPIGIGLAQLLYYAIAGKAEAAEWEKLQETKRGQAALCKT